MPTEGVAGKAVGPSLYFDIDIEGVRVTAMVDSGSPTTIISRSLLHRIANKLRHDSKPVPELLPPSVRLYGKDGPKGGPELLVTAETNLTLMADGKTVLIPVFIQPGSSQACLLGMNAAQPLGLLFLDSRGKPLRTTSEHLHGSESVLEQKSACVSLIHATTIPSHGGRFLKVQVGGDYRPGDQLIFGPQKDNLEPMGLSGVDSILTVHEEGTIFITVPNFCESKVIIPDGVELGRVEPFDESTVNASLPPHGVTNESACAKVIVNGPGYHEPERPPRLLGKLDLSQCDCNPEQLEDLKVLLSQHADVFALDPSELGCYGMVRHTIDTGDMPPLKQQPYRTPVVKREKVAQLIREMQEQGIVQPSSSAWASPVVLVPKKDSSSRFCVDYRRLNNITKKDVYPLPRIDDILDTLGQAKYFTTLDLASGYWQVELEPNSRAKTAFTTHCGLYEFNRMPFGLCNAPATFQRLMQVVLAGLVEWDCCFVYIDDILVASKSFEEHLHHLQLVFDCLRKADLRLKSTKCLFLCEEVPYLGYVISKHGIRPDPSKTDKVKEFPTPSDPTKVRQFLGLASYYRRFVPGFAKVAAPLHYLTKKDVPLHGQRSVNSLSPS